MQKKRLQETTLSIFYYFYEYHYFALKFPRYIPNYLDLFTVNLKIDFIYCNCLNDCAALF